MEQQEDGEMDGESPIPDWWLVLSKKNGGQDFNFIRERKELI